MALASGSRLGPYEIVAPLGAGGMGEVYRARDSRLKREVALKILPESFASDPERLARFQREAEVLASLNHPNIAAIYGLEGGALVLELVEGDTLADRIARGSIPLDEALPIARQIAEALEAAHERGIIHRDLKPANVKVTPAGAVKVLDFGLAKLAKLAESGSGIGDQGSGRTAAHVTNSPTITSPAMMTGAGMILGTAAYMSPEQAKGREADKRSDIWAFGCVLFEMLTGTRAFAGDDVTEVLASVIRSEPDWKALPAATPAAIGRLLRRCLQKDRTRRLADIADARLEIDEAIAAPASGADLGAVVPVAPRRSAWRAVAPWAAALLLSVVTGVIVWALRPAPATPQSVRFNIPPPGTVPAEMFSLSHDGRVIVFVAPDGPTTRLWIRPLDGLEARALSGTDGATYPFWSPDSSSIGFFAEGKLKKIALSGGPAQTLCDVADGRGGSWNSAGMIVFSDGPASLLQRVPATGGIPTAASTRGDRGTIEAHRFPVFLPDGQHFVYTVTSDQADVAGLYISSLAGAAPARLLPDVTNAMYVPGGSARGGWLLFRRDDTLMAQPFDPDGLTFTGDMFPVVEQIPNSRNAGFGAFSAAANGTLVYRDGREGSNRELAWVDRTGARLGVPNSVGAIFGALRLSPDQRTAAVIIGGGASDSHIWLQDLERDVLSRFTFQPGLHTIGAWSPDGNRLAYGVRPAGVTNTDIYQKSRGGNGEEELLVRAGVNGFVQDWSTDGDWILYQQNGPSNDLWLLPLAGDRKPVPYLQTPFNESGGRFWPAGNNASGWIAYVSNESGQPQVYVQTVPASGAKYQISTTGGGQPMWRRDGRELFYVSADRKLMAVPMAVGAGVTPGTPQALFDAEFSGYEPSADGQRFLVNVPAGGQAVAAPITVVLNWAASVGE